MCVRIDWNTLQNLCPDLQSEQVDASCRKSEPVCRFVLTDLIENRIVWWSQTDLISFVAWLLATRHTFLHKFVVFWFWTTLKSGSVWSSVVYGAFTWGIGVHASRLLWIGDIMHCRTKLWVCWVTGVACGRSKKNSTFQVSTQASANQIAFK